MVTLALVAPEPLRGDGQPRDDGRECGTVQRKAPVGGTGVASGFPREDVQGHDTAWVRLPRTISGHDLQVGRDHHEIKVARVHVSIGRLMTETCGYAVQARDDIVRKLTQVPE